jgi:YidC/Oxa1 family membrane protein insertase
MDRNSLLGLVLIGAILIGYSYLTAPTAEQIAAQKKTQDSLALVEKNRKVEVAQKTVTIDATTPSIAANDSTNALIPSHAAFTNNTCEPCKELIKK